MEICGNLVTSRVGQNLHMPAREWPAVEAAAERAETGLREDTLPFGEHGGA